PPSRAQGYLRHSALLQYLLGHLRFDPVQELRSALAALSPAPVKSVQPSTAYEAVELARVMEKFFARISPYRAGRLVMVFDCDRAALTRGESGSDSARLAAMAQARAHGALVVDLEAGFRDFLARNPRHLEISPLDSHWNREATRIVAREIATVLAAPAP
ncbi:unnamed protein product, partial [Phaeothamnion confervicola]